MLTVLFALAVVLALLLIAVQFDERTDASRSAQQREDDWLPETLRHGELVLAEPKAMKMDAPVMAVAKVDRAYRAGNVVVPVEFKTRRRHRVYDTDIAELSVQRLVLEANRFGPVADIAYVVTEDPLTRTRARHAVRLISRDATATLIRRYHAIASGDEPGEMTDDSRRCAGCGHRRRCGR